MPGTRTRVGSAIETALAVGLAAGCMDAALSLLERPYSLSTSFSLFPPITATLLFVSGLYLVVWFILGRPLSRWFRLAEARSRFALAAFLWLSFTFAALSGLFRARFHPPEVFKAFLVLALALSLAATCYAAAALAATLNGLAARYAIALARAIPFILFQVVLFEWVQMYVAESVVSLSSISACALLLVSIPLTLLLWSRAEGSHWHSRALLTFAAFVTVGPVLSSAVASSCRTGVVAGSDGSRSPKQVILLTVDTLRADALTSYNREAGPTPRIDGLASDGVLFERPISAAPWTVASLASILTGVSPSVHMITGANSRLPDTVPTLAELMRKSGYHTAAIVVNDLLHPRTNLSHGFEDYLFLTEPSYGGSFGASLLQRALPKVFPPAPWPSTDDVTDAAVDWLSRHSQTDFFLWLHYYDPHPPYSPPARYLAELSPPPGMGTEFYAQKDVMTGVRVLSAPERQWLQVLYRAEVRYLDDNVGRLVGELKRLGLYDGALVIFSSDHGEEFWEHAAYGHGHSLYGEVLSVPLIVKLPEYRDRGRVATRVATESITPTILDLCAIAYRKERFSSASLAPLLRAEPGEYQERPIVSAAQVLFDHRESVQFDDFKFVRSTIGGEEALFDLKRDPAERSSVLSSSPEAAERARALLQEHHHRSKQLRAIMGTQDAPEVQFDNETLRRLKALGYVP